MASLSRKIKRAGNKAVTLSEPQQHGRWMTNDEIHALLKKTIEDSFASAYAGMMDATAYILLEQWDKLQDPRYRLRVFGDLLKTVTSMKKPTPKMLKARHQLFMQTGLEIVEE